MSNTNKNFVSRTMDERELPSDSDDSDEDYVPSGAESNAPSEEESEGDDENYQEQSDTEESAESGKRKLRNAHGKKKKKVKTGRKRVQRAVMEPETEDVTSQEQKVRTEEEEKKRADSLWSDFLKDTGGSVNRSKSAITNGNEKESPAAKIELQKIDQKENKVTITKVFEFAGEEVRVTKEVASDSAEARLSAEGTPPSPAVSHGVSRGRGRGGSGGLKGLSSVLGQLGKKSKLGTLEKSKLDWDRYKKDEGIEEELQKYNKGRDGFLDRQDFLQRTDLRQFEIERELRMSRRSNR